MTVHEDDFTLAFNQTYPGLCRFLECLMNGESVAQDIAQETFLRFYALGAGAIPSDEARFWLYRVARNLALNELNKTSVRQRLWQKIGEVFRSPATNPEQDLEQQEAGKRVLELMQTLPEHQRSSLLLREQNEMSYREIARVLGVSEAKVKVDIFRARRALRANWKRLQTETE
jgi:RNA polymerase sigma factor (sigma-70 family)